MHKRSEFALSTISREGALFPPYFLQRVVERDSSLEGLSAEAYHVTGEKLNEAINRSWMRLLQKWQNFRRSSRSDNMGTVKEFWVFPLFVELGYGHLLTARPFEKEGKKYPISHGWGHVPIHIVSGQTTLDEPISKVRGSTARQSAHILVQELLNRSDEYLWGMATNGLRFRLLCRNRRLTHQTYIEFNLEAMMQGEAYADFALFWLLCHQSRFESEYAEACWLERWSSIAHEQNIRALDKLRIGVENAVRLLGQGFLECRSNQQLRDKLRSGALSARVYYRQLLRLIYRLIVLFVAEDRGLLLIPHADKDAKERYTKYYSTARLRSLAAKRYGSRHTDIFQGLRLVMQRLSEDPGCSELALPALDGFLFERGAMTDLENCDITNACLLEAVRSLAFLAQENGLRPVDYQHIGSEELGSVYEALLEFHPVVESEPPRFCLQVSLGNERKTSGSYYTPHGLVERLLDSTLEPVLTEACQQPDPAKAILSLKVCDPACGSGHFLIATAQRMAYRLAFERAGKAEPGRETWCQAMRDVMRNCIYGVDSNSMAVELCKVSLCIEAIEPGKPLVFLDHHIRCGDSLIGTTPALLRQGIPDSAFDPLEEDVPRLSQVYRKRNQEGHAGQWHLLIEPMDEFIDQFQELQTQDDSSCESIQWIKKRHQSLIEMHEYQTNMLIAHAWCAAFFWRKVYIDSQSLAYPFTQGILRELLENRRTYQDMRREIERLTEQYQFFHWHLAFPDVFRIPAKDEIPENEQTGWSGGFDVVLGNPPYIFGEHRDQRRKAFLQTLFHLAKGQYDIYWLFIERCLNLTNSRGRCALVVPDTVLARDETQKTREVLLQSGLECISHCGAVFKASVSTIFFVVAKGSKAREVLAEVLDGATVQTKHWYRKERFLADSKQRFLIHLSDEEARIFSRIEQECQPLQHFVRISRGEEIGKKSVFAQGPIPILVGEDISRYDVQQPSRFLLTIKKDASRYQSPKIVLLKTGYRCIAGLDTESHVTMQSVYNLHITAPEIAYEALLALLNSRLIYCFLYKTFTSYKSIFPQLNQSTIQAIPVSSNIYFFQDELLHLVQEIQWLNQEQKHTQEKQEESLLRSQIESVDRRIDQVIYHLYGLTTDEVNSIESRMV